MKEFLFSWKGITLAIVLVIAGLANSCGGDNKTKTTDKEGNEIEVDFNDPSAYIEAVNGNDFQLAHKVLDHLYSRYLKQYNNDELDRYGYNGDQKYWTAANHVYKAEMMYLLAENDPEANKRLIFSLQNMNVIGEEPREGVEYGYTDNKKKKCYAEFVDKYNALCDEILSISITNGNEDMADKIVKLYKEAYIEKEAKNSEDYTINYYTHDTTAKDRAKARLAEAKANGEFE